MVMELAENGDLLAHLKDTEQTNHRTIQNLDSSEERFYLQNKHPLLFSYMWNVAKGMEYLTNMKVLNKRKYALIISYLQETVGCWI